MPRRAGLVLAGAIALVASTAPQAIAAVCTVPTASYPTIQSAVDDPNCKPIKVKRGTFNEDVVINRGVIITGAGSARTVVDGTGTARSSRSHRGPR